MKELAQRGEKWARRNGRSPYPVMDTFDICRLDVQSIAAKNCVLFMWATYPKLEEAFDVIRSWSFTYKTVAFTWVKTNRKRGLAPIGELMKVLMTCGDLNEFFRWLFHFGLGYWCHGNPEVCLLATRGHPKRVSRFVANLTISPLRGHSSKPKVIREKIVELCGDLPRVELFARPPLPDNWDAWGNEVDCDVKIPWRSREEVIAERIVWAIEGIEYLAKKYMEV